MKINLFKKYDLILYFFLAAAALGFYFIPSAAREFNIVRITAPDTDIRIKLPAVKKYEITSKAGYAVIEINDYEVRFASSTCPQKICVKMGVLTTTNPLICVPNEIAVIAESERKNIDAVTQ